MAWALCCRGAVIWGSSLGTARAGKSLTSDLPGFLRKVKKTGTGVETSEGSCRGGRGCIERLVSGEESPEYCAGRPVNSFRTWTPGERGGLLRSESVRCSCWRLTCLAGWDASQKCRCSQMKGVSTCPLISTLVFQKDGPWLAVLGTGRGGYLEKNVASRMHLQRSQGP